MFLEIREGRFVGICRHHETQQILDYEQLSLDDFFRVHKKRFLQDRGRRPIDDVPEGTSYQVFDSNHD